MSSFPWHDFLLSLPATLVAVVVVFAVTLLVAQRVGKQAVVDIVWGPGFGIIAIVSFLASAVAGQGDTVRRLAALVLTVAWGARLGTHIYLRSRGKGEDPRYEAMLKKSKGHPIWFIVKKVYLTQGAIMWFVSLPVQVAMFQSPTMGIVAWIGVAIWVIGFVFETVGDLQLTRFREDPSTKGQVLNTGLWRFTRHPNYFGDACVWVGLSLIAFDAWPGIVTILSPAVMIWLLAKGTGKPLLEKSMQKRRPGYKEYVEATSGFFPLPPKKVTPRKSNDPSTEPEKESTGS